MFGALTSGGATPKFEMLSVGYPMVSKRAGGREGACVGTCV
jgi:hypothetical protein